MTSNPSRRARTPEQYSRMAELVSYLWIGLLIGLAVAVPPLAAAAGGRDAAIQATIILGVVACAGFILMTWLEILAYLLDERSARREVNDPS